MFATPRAKHLASRIAEVLESYRQDPQQFQAFRSPGEWRRAQSLARLFPKSLNEAQIRETLSDPQVFNAGQLLLGDPDLLNFAAEALPFYENTSPLPAKPPSHIAGLRQQLPNNRPAGPEKLQADPFWCLVYNISQIRNWRDLLDQQAEPFDQVLREELVQIVASREKREINAPKPDYSGSIEETAESCHLMGLAFSGGGIRSATVALGVLQGLAQLRLLSWFDYLSTVSGGGYIGAWLSAWIKRSDFKNDANQPSPSDAALPSKAAQTSLGFLRRFSNYLTPELGFLSADTWTLFAIWFRNILLNSRVAAAPARSAVLVRRHRPHGKLQPDSCFRVVTISQLHNRDQPLRFPADGCLRKSRVFPFQQSALDSRPHRHTLDNLGLVRRGEFLLLPSHRLGQRATRSAPRKPGDGRHSLGPRLRQRF